MTTATSVVPDRPVAGAVDAAVASLEKALAQDVWRLADAELGQLVQALDRARAVTERLAVAVVAEAHGRGTPAADGASSTSDWVAARSPWLGPREAHQLAGVAVATGQSEHAPLSEAVAAGGVPVRCAHRVLRTVTGVRPFLGPVDYQDAQRLLLPLAGTGTDKELDTAARHLVACVAPRGDLDRVDRAQRAARSLTERPGPGGMTDFTWRADPETTAFIHAAVGPLAKPVPDQHGPDPRSPATRRADALLTVLQRGLSAGLGQEPPVTGRARVLVTMSLQSLLDRLGEQSGTGGTATGQPQRVGTTAAGQPQRVATTATGDHLTVAVARRLACDAELIPAVLGTRSQVLDLGHAARLASTGQHLVLWRRDRGCTYPGCTVPPTWCRAHHITWWSRGGRTDLDNLALLCDRHHTLVHDRDLTATITSDEVTWHT